MGMYAGLLGPDAFLQACSRGGSWGLLWALLVLATAVLKAGSESRIPDASQALGGTPEDGSEPTELFLREVGVEETGSRPLLSVSLGAVTCRRKVSLNTGISAPVMMFLVDARPLEAVLWLRLGDVLSRDLSTLELLSCAHRSHGGVDAPDDFALLGAYQLVIHLVSVWLLCMFFLYSFAGSRHLSRGASEHTLLALLRQAELLLDLALGENTVEHSDAALGLSATGIRSLPRDPLRASLLHLLPWTRGAGACVSGRKGLKLGAGDHMRFPRSELAEMLRRPPYVSV